MKRPDGWDKILKDAMAELYASDKAIFEAGADAMLEGLKGENTFPDWIPVHIKESRTNGVWVFIPEE